MVKLTIKLAIVALIANALYQVVPSYYTDWQFQDAMKELATYPGYRATLPQVLDKCEKIAKAYDLDLTRTDFDVKMAGVGGPGHHDRRELRGRPEAGPRPPRCPTCS